MTFFVTVDMGISGSAPHLFYHYNFDVSTAARVGQDNEET